VCVPVTESLEVYSHLSDSLENATKIIDLPLAPPNNCGELKTPCGGVGSRVNSDTLHKPPEVGPIAQNQPVKTKREWDLWALSQEIDCLRSIPHHGSYGVPELSSLRVTICNRFHNVQIIIWVKSNNTTNYQYRSWCAYLLKQTILLSSRREMNKVPLTFDSKKLPGGALRCLTPPAGVGLDELTPGNRNLETDKHVPPIERKPEDSSFQKVYIDPIPNQPNSVSAALLAKQLERSRASDSLLDPSVGLRKMGKFPEKRLPNGDAELPDPPSIELARHNTDDSNHEAMSEALHEVRSIIPPKLLNETHRNLLIEVHSEWGSDTGVAIAPQLIPLGSEAGSWDRESSLGSIPPATPGALGPAPWWELALMSTAAKRVEAWKTQQKAEVKVDNIKTELAREVSACEKEDRDKGTVRLTAPTEVRRESGEFLVQLPGASKAFKEVIAIQGTRREYNALTISGRGDYTVEYEKKSWPIIPGKKKGLKWNILPGSGTGPDGKPRPDDRNSLPHQGVIAFTAYAAKPEFQAAREVLNQLGDGKSYMLPLNEPPKEPSPPYVCSDTSLNAEQRAAVEGIVNAHPGARIVLVGPPATGKTRTGRAATLVIIEKGGRVLILAPTNALADEWVGLLREDGVNALRIESQTYARSSRKPAEGSLQWLEDTSSAKEVARYVKLKKECLALRVLPKRLYQALKEAMRDLYAYLLEEFSVVVTTVSHAPNVLAKLGPFDYRVIDEAAAVRTFCGLLRQGGSAENSFITVDMGDNLQMPPSGDADKYGSDLLSFALARGATRYDLREQYRMDPEIFSAVNKLFYDGNLKTGKSSGEKSMTPNVVMTTLPQLHSEGRFCSSSLTEHITTEVIPRIPREFTILVLCNYSLQKEQLRVKCRDLKFTHVRVSTIKPSQGTEGDVVIYVPGGEWGKIPFLTPNMINVAISRAKLGIIIVNPKPREMESVSPGTGIGGHLLHSIRWSLRASQRDQPSLNQVRFKYPPGKSAELRSAAGNFMKAPLEVEDEDSEVDTETEELDSEHIMPLPELRHFLVGRTVKEDDDDWAEYDDEEGYEEPYEYRPHTKIRPQVHILTNLDFGIKKRELVSFEHKGKTFTSFHQYLEYRKAELFGDVSSQQEIMKRNCRGKWTKGGKNIRGFRPETWYQCRDTLSYEGHRARIMQNAALQKALLDTGDKEIGDASGDNTTYQVGLKASDPRILDTRNWIGENRNGKYLMKVRDELREQENRNIPPSPPSRKPHVQATLRCAFGARIPERGPLAGDAASPRAETSPAQLLCAGGWVLPRPEKCRAEMRLFGYQDRAPDAYGMGQSLKYGWHKTEGAGEQAARISKEFILKGETPGVSGTWNEEVREREQLPEEIKFGEFTDDSKPSEVATLGQFLRIIAVSDSCTRALALRTDNLEGFLSNAKFLWQRFAQVEQSATGIAFIPVRFSGLSAYVFLQMLCFGWDLVTTLKAWEKSQAAWKGSPQYLDRALLTSLHWLCDFRKGVVYLTVEEKRIVKEAEPAPEAPKDQFPKITVELVGKESEKVRTSPLSRFLSAAVNDPKWTTGWQYQRALVDDVGSTHHTLGSVSLGLLLNLKTLKTMKAQFGLRKAKFATRALDLCSRDHGQGGWSSDIKAVKKIVNFPLPRNKGEMQTFLGYLVYFRDTLGPRYCTLTDALRKHVSAKAAYHHIINDPIALRAFIAIKERISAIVYAPVDRTAILRGERILLLMVDASASGVGCVVVSVATQIMQGGDHEAFLKDVVLHEAHSRGFASKRVREPILLECSGIIFIKNILTHLSGLPRVLCCDHWNLVAVDQNPVDKRSSASDLALVSEVLDFVRTEPLLQPAHLAGVANVDADYLSRSNPHGLIDEDRYSDCETQLRWVERNISTILDHLFPQQRLAFISQREKSAVKREKETSSGGGHKGGGPSGLPSLFTTIGSASRRESTLLETDPEDEDPYALGAEDNRYADPVALMQLFDSDEEEEADPPLVIPSNSGKESISEKYQKMLSGPRERENYLFDTNLIEYAEPPDAYDLNGEDPDPVDTLFTKYTSGWYRVVAPVKTPGITSSVRLFAIDSEDWVMWKQGWLLTYSVIEDDPLETGSWGLVGADQAKEFEGSYPELTHPAALTQGWRIISETIVRERADARGSYREHVPCLRGADIVPSSGTTAEHVGGLWYFRPREGITPNPVPGCNLMPHPSVEHVMFWGSPPSGVGWDIQPPPKLIKPWDMWGEIPPLPALHPDPDGTLPKPPNHMELVDTQGTLLMGRGRAKSLKEKGPRVSVNKPRTKKDSEVVRGRGNITKPHQISMTTRDAEEEPLKPGEALEDPDDEELPFLSTGAEIENSTLDLPTVKSIMVDLMNGEKKELTARQSLHLHRYWDCASVTEMLWKLRNTNIKLPPKVDFKSCPICLGIINVARRKTTGIMWWEKRGVWTGDTLIISWKPLRKLNAFPQVTAPLEKYWGENRAEKWRVRIFRTYNLISVVMADEVSVEDQIADLSKMAALKNPHTWLPRELRVSDSDFRGHLFNLERQGVSIPQIPREHPDALTGIGASQRLCRTMVENHVATLTDQVMAQGDSSPSSIIKMVELRLQQSIDAKIDPEGLLEGDLDWLEGAARRGEIDMSIARAYDTDDVRKVMRSKVLGSFSAKVLYKEGLVIIFLTSKGHAKLGRMAGRIDRVYLIAAGGFIYRVQPRFCLVKNFDPRRIDGVETHINLRSLVRLIHDRRWKVYRVGIKVVTEDVEKQALSEAAGQALLADIKDRSLEPLGSMQTHRAGSKYAYGVISDWDMSIIDCHFWKGCLVMPVGEKGFQAVGNLVPLDNGEVGLYWEWNTEATEFSLDGESQARLWVPTTPSEVIKNKADMLGKSVGRSTKHKPIQLPPGMRLPPYKDELPPKSQPGTTRSGSSYLRQRAVASHQASSSSSAVQDPSDHSAMQQVSGLLSGPTPGEAGPQSLVGNVSFNDVSSSLEEGVLPSDPDPNEEREGAHDPPVPQFRSLQDMSAAEFVKLNADREREIHYEKPPVGPGQMLLSMHHTSYIQQKGGKLSEPLVVMIDSMSKAGPPDANGLHTIHGIIILSLAIRLNLDIIRLSPSEMAGEHILWGYGAALTDARPHIARVQLLSFDKMGRPILSPMRYLYCLPQHMTEGLRCDIGLGAFEVQAEGIRCETWHTEYTRGHKFLDGTPLQRAEVPMIVPTHRMVGPQVSPLPELKLAVPLCTFQSLLQANTLVPVAAEELPQSGEEGVLIVEQPPESVPLVRTSSGRCWVRVMLPQGSTRKWTLLWLEDKTHSFVDPKTGVQTSRIWSRTGPKELDLLIDTGRRRKKKGSWVQMGCLALGPKVNTTKPQGKVMESVGPLKGDETTEDLEKCIEGDPISFADLPSTSAKAMTTEGFLRVVEASDLPREYRDEVAKCLEEQAQWELGLAEYSADSDTQTAMIIETLRHSVDLSNLWGWEKYVLSAIIWHVALLHRGEYHVEGQEVPQVPGAEMPLSLLDPQALPQKGTGVRKGATSLIHRYKIGLLMRRDVLLGFLACYNPRLYGLPKFTIPVLWAPRAGKFLGRYVINAVSLNAAWRAFCSPSCSSQQSCDMASDSGAYPRGPPAPGGPRGPRRFYSGNDISRAYNRVAISAALRGYMLLENWGDSYVCLRAMLGLAPLPALWEYLVCPHFNNLTINEMVMGEFSENLLNLAKESRLPYLFGPELSDEEIEGLSPSYTH
jgi:ribA/ribD-fused uncharacterized protein